MHAIVPTVAMMNTRQPGANQVKILSVLWSRQSAGIVGSCDWFAPQNRGARTLNCFNLVKKVSCCQVVNTDTYLLIL